MPLLAETASDSTLWVLLGVASIGTLLWIVILAVALAVRRPPHIKPIASTMELPPESPAVAGMLAGGFVVRAETAPAILLDLATRHVVDLDEVQPGKTICRIRNRRPTPLSRAEVLVIDAISEKAIDGVVPADALTTGAAERSKGWHRTLAAEVVAESQALGLTRDRWPNALVGALWTVLAIIAVVVVFALKAANARDVEAVGVIITVGVAIAVIGIGVVILERLGRSLAQLPTEAGLSSATRVRGLERHLREDKLLAELPPASVKVRGRHFAYAAAFGLAPVAVDLLPMGAEDDHRAWSRVGGRWRQIRVRYPRAWPPAWGKHPALAALLAIVSGFVAGFALSGLIRVTDADRPSGASPSEWRWVERGALVLLVPFVLLMLWALLVFVRAVPDFWSTREISGEIVRDRRYRQWLASGDNPKYWNYLAVDDGTSDRIVALRLRESLWREHNQGDEVTAEITPGLGYVRTMTKKSRA